MGSKNSQPESKQNYTREVDPSVQQFLNNLTLFTNVVCQQPQSQQASGANIPSNNTIVFYPVENEPSPDPRYNPYASSPYSQQPDSIIILPMENYENAKDTDNYGTIQKTWRKQNRYEL